MRRINILAAAAVALPGVLRRSRKEKSAAVDSCRDRTIRRSPGTFNRLNRAGALILALFLQFAPSLAGAQSSQQAEKREVRIPAGEVVLAETLFRPNGAHVRRR